METFTFCCSECSCSFDPDPAMLVELVWMKYEVEDDDVGDALTPEDLEFATAEDLAYIGLTCADRDTLLAGGQVPGGAEVICRGCQDRMAVEA